MGQVATLRALDGVIMRSLRAAGMADAAVYTPAMGSPIACEVLVDRGVQVLGEFGNVTGRRTEITFLAPAFAPAKGESVSVGSETWVLETLLDADDSAVLWVVTKVTA